MVIPAAFHPLGNFPSLFVCSGFRVPWVKRIACPKHWKISFSPTSNLCTNFTLVFSRKLSRDLLCGKIGFCFCFSCSLTFLHSLFANSLWFDCCDSFVKATDVIYQQTSDIESCFVRVYLTNSIVQISQSGTDTRKWDCNTGWSLLLPNVSVSIWLLFWKNMLQARLMSNKEGEVKDQILFLSNRGRMGGISETSCLYMTHSGCTAPSTNWQSIRKGYWP